MSYRTQHVIDIIRIQSVCMYHEYACDWHEWRNGETPMSRGRQARPASFGTTSGQGGIHLIYTVLTV